MAIKARTTVTLTQYRDIQSVTRYYKLRPAGSSAPLKPETKPPSSDWTDSEPTCDISKELYFCDLTVFSNGEWEYSTVSKSSSYEAAKEAYNKADNAQSTANEALKGSKENATQMAQMVKDFNGDIENLQNQIDGNIATWFYGVDPAMNLPPVTDWDTDEKKNAHLGDIYYNTVKGYAWRFMKSGSTYSWERITDTDVTKALSDAAKAQDTADSKRRVFYNTPTVPYDAGDLWVQGSGGDILRCAQAKTSTGSYNRNDWVLASKYTDDSALNTWIEGDFATTIQDLEDGIVDAKIETYYQATDPSTGWSDTQKSEHKGDLWYNSTASVQKYYRWSGTAWQELTATPPHAVFDSIDKKATIYTGTATPTNPSSGDLWFKGADEPILTYVNSSWVEYNKYTDDSTLNTWLTDTYDVDKTNLQNQIDGKAETWYQATDPSLDWSAADKPNHEGDLWYNTSDNTTWYYTGSAWSQQSIPTSVFNNINGKANIFVGSTAPENPKTGDLWLESASSDILTYVGGSWVKYNKYTDDTKAEQAQADIDNLEVGGRNLFIETDYENIKTQGSTSTRGWYQLNNIKSSIVDDNSEKAAKIAGNSWDVAQYVNVEAGKTYIMSCFARLETERSGAKLLFRPDVLQIYDRNFDKDLTTDYQKFTYTWTCGVGGIERIHIRTGNANDVLYVKKIKFEKGNRATDWTPAPEDVDEGIKNAAKVATNFMEYDSTNGLIVGNKTSGTWSGYRSQILPGSFNVLDASSTVLASFGPTTVIGEEANANMHLTFNNLSMVDKDRTKFFEVGDNRNAEGIATVKHSERTSVNNYGAAVVTVHADISSIVSVYVDSVELSSSSYSLDDNIKVIIRNLTPNTDIYVEITYTTLDPYFYLTFGNRLPSSEVGMYSVAEGRDVTASGYCSHAEGRSTTASGEYSHAEGYNTAASGDYSHAEGYNTTASGYHSHAEGLHTIASGNGSHTEGDDTTASGYCSHAGGLRTVADGNYMTAIGKYNTKNSGKAFAIGNGTGSADRSDAFTVDWDGNTTIKGRLICYGMAGEIKMWAGNNIPSGWLLCDGSEVSKTKYPNLYAAIGDLWGTPNSSSNFKLPNLKGKVPVGYDSADTDFSTVGKTDGEKMHKLTPDEIPAHGHGMAHTHSYTGPNTGTWKVGTNGKSHNWCTSAGGKTSGGASKTTTDNAGGSLSHNNLQPYAVVKYIICAF